MNTAEASARHLADLLFLIQDYDQAMQIYKMSMSDFKVCFIFKKIYLELEQIK